jgi:hypothetical protein
LLAAFLVLSAGCGSPPAATVHGKLLMDGKPLAGAIVQMWPQDDLTLDVYYGDGITDADGRFKLKGRDGPSVKPGKYVLLVKLLASRGDAPQGGDAAKADPRGGGPNLLPEVYSDRERTPHNHIEIVPGANELPPFELKSKP